MKRLITGLLLCFIMGFTQVTFADTTNSGATTNSQTNTSGSKTTISGGYSYTKVGDVTVTHLAAPGVPSGLTATYADNKVTGIGLKVGFSF